MRVLINSLLGALALLALLLISGGNGASTAEGDVLTTHSLFAQPVASCATPSTDDGAYAMNGTKLPAGGLTFKVNQNTFPAGLNVLETHVAIGVAFATWDGATSKTLFTHGGVTNATPGASDGISTVGFRKIKSSAVAVTTGWYNRKTKVLTEFDVALNVNYGWATNPFATGDCGGAAGRFDVLNVMAHESGHAVGLADVTQSISNAQSMFAYVAYGELTKRTPASGDLKGLSVLYDGAQPSGQQSATATGDFNTKAQ